MREAPVPKCGVEREEDEKSCKASEDEDDVRRITRHTAEKLDLI